LARTPVSKHIDENVNCAHTPDLGVIKRNFIYLGAECFTHLYKSIIM